MLIFKVFLAMLEAIVINLAIYKVNKKNKYFFYYQTLIIFVLKLYLYYINVYDHSLILFAMFILLSRFYLKNDKKRLIYYKMIFDFLIYTICELVLVILLHNFIVFSQVKIFIDVVFVIILLLTNKHIIKCINKNYRKEEYMLIMMLAIIIFILSRIMIYRKYDSYIIQFTSVLMLCYVFMFVRFLMNIYLKYDCEINFKNNISLLDNINYRLNETEHTMYYLLLSIKQYIVVDQIDKAIILIDESINKLNKNNFYIHTKNPRFDFLFSKLLKNASNKQVDLVVVCDVGKNDLDDHYCSIVIINILNEVIKMTSSKSTISIVIRKQNNFLLVSLKIHGIKNEIITQIVKDNDILNENKIYFDIKRINDNINEIKIIFL